MAQDDVFRSKPSDAAWTASSGANRLGCASVGCALKETQESVVSVEICVPPSALCNADVALAKNSHTMLAKLRLKSSSVRSLLAPPRTPSLGACGWLGLVPEAKPAAPTVCCGPR